MLSYRIPSVSMDEMLDTLHSPRTCYICHLDGEHDYAGRTAPAPSHYPVTCRTYLAYKPSAPTEPRPGSSFHHPHVRQAVRPTELVSKYRPSSSGRRRPRGPSDALRVTKRVTWTALRYRLDPPPADRQRPKCGYQPRGPDQARLRQSANGDRRSPSSPPNTLSHFMQVRMAPAVKPRLRPSTWANTDTNRRLRRAILGR